MQCMVEGNALSSQLQHFQSASAIYNTVTPHQNYTKCGMWYNYSSDTHACECLSLWILNCDGMNAFINRGQMLTYDLYNQVVTATLRYLDGYNMTIEGHILLPNDISELNQYICGPLNRKAHLCSECKNGYGPAMVLTMCTNVCYACSDNLHSVILYFLLELVPITAFYILILVLQIKLTSAPMTCFIFYSQLIVMAFDGECANKTSPNLFSHIKFRKNGDLQMETKIILTLYGIFNLDSFQKLITPLCLSSKLKPVHSLFLGYASAFYTFVLIILTWLCVDLHCCNYKVSLFMEAIS